MQIKNCVLLVGTVFASVTVADNAHEIDDTTDLGLISKAYIDPATHKLLVEDFSQAESSAIQERSYNTGSTGNTQDTIAQVLKKHNGYGFCKAACGGYYPQPVTQTQLKTLTKTTYKTATIVPQVVTITRTATAGTPPADTATTTTTESTTVDITETAQPSTTTSTVSTIFTATESVVTTVTSTIQIPSPAPTVFKRENTPSWLRGYASHLICPACNQVWPKPKPQTVIVYKTTTRASTQTRTSSKPATTQTVVLTTTPAAGTYTLTETTVQTKTNTLTSTPLQTDVVTLSSTTTTTEIATSTVSICAQQTNNVGGISAGPNGGLEPKSARSIAECCSACYNSASSCNQWAFLGAGACYIAIGRTASGNDATCPNGRGAGVLFQGGPPELAGGPGPCHT
ncbi:hypothetical protein P171DRAFT_434609 [Karstenula rhodostoma CBS 690.94]|uniref:Apple domain-containing protein n=1 Tax=Karstenula rhodostoma CBS 690.94 TaxID=1392251 RepID=A0A9P4P9G9_9PLEO|nr:hypothetical protein P171DRAFT_434609 [Karstenula rhodostoma CBS 690.94]